MLTVVDILGFVGISGMAITSAIIQCTLEKNIHRIRISDDIGRDLAHNGPRVWMISTYSLHNYGKINLN